MLYPKKQMEVKMKIKEIEKVINTIEGQLNQHEDWEECFYVYDLFVEDKKVKVYIYDDGIFVYKIELDARDCYSIESTLKAMINYLYENEINFRNKYIKGASGFNSRKIKSLANWMEKCNEEKVQKINEELATRYKTTKKYKCEVEQYKDFIRDFYSCMNILCPNWKIKDIKDKLLERLSDYNIVGVSATYINNKLFVYKIRDDKIVKNIEIIINAYTNINETINYIIDQLRVA